MIEKPLATIAGAWYQGTALDDDARSASTARRAPSVTLEELEEAIDAVIAEVADKGVTAEELERCQDRSSSPTRSMPRTARRRWRAGTAAALTTGLTVDQSCKTWPDRVRAVTAEQVRDAAQAMARQAPLGHRLSGQGHRPSREEKRS